MGLQFWAHHRTPPCIVDHPGSRLKIDNQMPKPFSLDVSCNESSLSDARGSAIYTISNRSNAFSHPRTRKVRKSRLTLLAAPRPTAPPSLWERNNGFLSSLCNGVSTKGMPFRPEAQCLAGMLQYTGEDLRPDPQRIAYRGQEIAPS
ncbi:hypothetical protein CSAL01_06366 [Colletotrichum salicis]|uniref:Uncharacterized protein n=1 Tax=Colletotrichum salicis TaxID=1209931 RepID=A0A135US66_9PEZI|nr:hypothetical protein CSAL01_06366 [Colletotrichum salicis]